MNCVPFDFILRVCWEILLPPVLFLFCFPCGFPHCRYQIVMVNKLPENGDRLRGMKKGLLYDHSLVSIQPLTQRFLYFSHYMYSMQSHQTNHFVFYQEICHFLCIHESLLCSCLEFIMVYSRLISCHKKNPYESIKACWINSFLCHLEGNFYAFTIAWTVSFTKVLRDL